MLEIDEKIEDLQKQIKATEKALKKEQTLFEHHRAQVAALEAHLKTQGEELHCLLRDYDHALHDYDDALHDYDHAPTRNNDGDDWSRVHPGLHLPTVKRVYNAAMNSDFDWVAKYGRGYPGDKSLVEFKRFFQEIKDGKVDFPDEIPSNKTGVWGVWFAGSKYVLRAIQNGDL